MGPAKKEGFKKAGPNKAAALFYKAKVQKKQAENPFDKFANSRKKHEVVNRRVKGEDRNVGRARAKAVDERKQKLLKDFQSNKKTNSFVDRRFGEADADMSLEEKMFMRFQREKVKKAKNLSLYNLDSEETHVLTHKGATLGEANMVDDADLVSSDDEDRLGREVVNNLHFGGGFVKKSGESEIDQKSHAKSKSEILQEIVMKSKLHKMQKREAKDAQESQREDIDKQFEELIASSAVEFNPMGKYNRRSDRDGVVSDNKNDEFADYDTYFGAMQYESKAQPSDRTKSAEELAVEARERLERLENDRLKRMNQTEVTDENDAQLSIVPKNKKRHINDDEVDEFGDNYGWNNKDDNDQSEDGDEQDEDEDSEEDEDDGSDEGSDEDDGESDDEDEDDDDGELDDNSNLDENSNEDDSDIEEEDEEEDNEDYDSAEEAEYDKKLLELLKVKEQEEKLKKSSNNNSSSSSKSKDIKSHEIAKPASEEVEKIKGKRVKVEPKNTLGIDDGSINSNMPHSINCPADIVEFEEIIEKYVVNVSVDFPELVNRILIWNSIHLPGAQGNLNRPLMHNFTDVLVKFFVKVGNDLRNKAQRFTMNELNYLSKCIFKISQDLPEATTALFGRTITIMHSQLEKRLRDYVQGTLGTTCYPSLGNMLLLQLLGSIYSVTDNRNSIILSVSLLLCQCLTQCPVSNLQDASHAVLASTILLGYTAETKKILPEILSSVCGILLSFGSGNALNNWTRIVNRESMSKWIRSSTLHLLNDKSAKSSLSIPKDWDRMRWSYFADASDSSEDNLYAHIALLNSLETVIKDCHFRLLNSVAYVEIMTPFVLVLDSIVTSGFPDELIHLHADLENLLKENIEKSKASRKPLAWRMKTVVAIESLAPRYEVNYTMKRDLDPDKARVQVKQLTRQVKREHKAAMRELRRDSDFLGQEIFKSKQAVREKKLQERAANYAWMEEQQATINQQVRKGGELIKGGGSGVAKPLRRVKRQKR